MVTGNGRRSGVLQRREARPDAWTAAVRRQFLINLAASCNVKASCKAVGKHPAGLYRLRERDPAFASQWDAALEQGYGRLEAELLRRALGDAVAGEAQSSQGSAPDEPDSPFDPELALRLLAQRGKGGRTGRGVTMRQKQPSPEEVMAALDRKLTAMERRLGKRP